MTPSDWILDDGLRGRVARWWTFSMKPRLQDAADEARILYEHVACLVRGHPDDAIVTVEAKLELGHPGPVYLQRVELCRSCNRVTRWVWMPTHPNCRCSTTIGDDEEDPG